MTSSYHLFSCIIGTPVYTIEWFAERHKQNGEYYLGQKFSLLYTRYFFSHCVYLYFRDFLKCVLMIEAAAHSEDSTSTPLAWR